MSFDHLPCGSDLRKIASISIAMAVALSLSERAASAQERIAIAGTTVSLAPPKDFIPATGFAGLTAPTTNTAVQVIELPASAYDQIAPRLANIEDARLAFAPLKVEVRKLEQIDISGQAVPLVIGRQTVGGAGFDKWVVLLKGARTVFVTVQSPVESKLDPTAVRAMLTSIALGAEPSLADKLKALPFAIEAADPFRIVDTIGGYGVLMTVGQLDADPVGIQPLLIAAYQLSGPPLTESQLESTAESLLRRLPGFGTASVTLRGKARLGGRDGVMLAGRVQEKGIDKRFEQYLALGKTGRYLQVIASADIESFDGLKPAMNAIVDSITFTEAK